MPIWMRRDQPQGDPLAQGSQPSPQAAQDEGADAGALSPEQKRALALLRFAQLSTHWGLSFSEQDLDALLADMTDDVRAPSFRGRGRIAVRRGLKTLATQFGQGFRLALGELDGTPVLIPLVKEDDPHWDNHWQRAGYFVVGLAEDGAISYLDYQEEKGEGPSIRIPRPRRQSAPGLPRPDRRSAPQSEPYHFDQNAFDEFWS